MGAYWLAAHGLRPARSRQPLRSQLLAGSLPWSIRPRTPQPFLSIGCQKT